MRHIPSIPPREYWPVGFTTDYITAWPDWVLTRTGYVLSGRVAGWWHDLGYFLGYVVHWDVKWTELRNLRPVPNGKRSEVQRKAIDKVFYATLRLIGYDRWLSWLMYRVVRRVSATHYWLPRASWRGSEQET